MLKLSGKYVTVPSRVDATVTKLFLDVLTVQSRQLALEVVAIGAEEVVAAPPVRGYE